MGTSIASNLLFLIYLRSKRKNSILHPKIGLGQQNQSIQRKKIRRNMLFGYVENFFGEAILCLMRHSSN